MSTSTPRLLEGIRIIDLTSVVFGPYCTQTLADLGAEVIKIEAPPLGDIFRLAGTPAQTPLMGACHMTLNRGKRSALLDLKEENDQALLRAMLQTADVFIHNVREEAIGRLGFSYAEVKALNPDIIYVHCMGFGAGGPYSDLQAYDDVIQAASGVTTLETRVDGDPRPRYVPSTIADKIAGLHAAYATLAAIVHRLRTGAGQKVEVPMFEAFTGFLLEEHLYNGTFIPPTGAICYPRQVDPNRQPYKTADGYISIVPYSEQNVVTLFELLGVPELLQDPRFDNPIARLSNQSQVCMEVAKLTPSHSTAELLTLLNAARIPAMAVRDIADILDDPHLVAVDFFEQREHPTEGKYHAMRPPVRFSAVGDIEVRHAPMVGEHTEELRREFMGANEKI